MRAPLDLAQSAGQCSYDPLTTPPIPRAGNLTANAVTTGKDGVIFRPPGPADQLGHFIAQKEQMAAERISEPADVASGVHANGALAGCCCCSASRGSTDRAAQDRDRLLSGRASGVGNQRSTAGCG